MSASLKNVVWIERGDDRHLRHLRLRHFSIFWSPCSAFHPFYSHYYGLRPFATQSSPYRRYSVSLISSSFSSISILFDGGKFNQFYVKLIMNLFFHFFDSEIFHYIPLLLISQKIDVIMFIALLLGFPLRILNIVSMFKTNIFKREEERKKWEVAIKIWYVIVEGVDCGV